MISSASTALLLVLAPTLALADTFSIYHRTVFPSQPGPLPEFTLRGTVDVVPKTEASPLALGPFQAVVDGLTLPDGRHTDDPQAFYQLALQRHPDHGPNQWDLQSVKLCHLPTSTSDTISFVPTPSGDRIWAFDYYVAPIPADGSCPKTVAKTSALESFSNTTVALRWRNFPLVTTLRNPIPLTQTGQPVAPPVEKSFFQKYWMYILGGVMLLMATIPDPQDENAPVAAK